MKKFAALTTAAVAVVLLAGCASGSGGSDGDATTAAKPVATQSKAEACKTLESDMKSVSTQLQSQMTKFQSDPTAAVATLKDFDGKLKAATDKVTNKEVHETAAGFEQSFSNLVGQLEAFSKDPKSVDSTKLQDSITDVQSSTQAMSKVCD
ncbi:MULTISPECIES: hypothetical protein [unclassified Curtobacterium]|uniref:hypothetical protein n=1 Tax=unclassified Curtobacterium TaxID=257496 RepID=UPI000F4D1A55|nr:MULTISPECIES: hypothetical protein [unclassified Curtobacterium]ROP58780.1 hypothetical protein EDF55_3524 [Curtobacterium sp. ZW137]TCK66494.1 hypothetical protein EDF27_1252 [Curtobacterium sp. PhB136]